MSDGGDDILDIAASYAELIGGQAPPVATAVVTAPSTDDESMGEDPVLQALGWLHYSIDILPRTQDQAGMAELLTGKVGGWMGWDAEQQRFYVFDPQRGHWVLDGVRAERVRRYVRVLSLLVKDACDREILSQKLPQLVKGGDKDAKAKIAAVMSWYKVFANSGLQGVARALEHTATEVTGAEFNKDSRLLHTRSGTIDVRTGEVRPGRPEDRLAHVVDVEYKPELAAGGVELEDVAPHFAQLLRRACAAPGEVAPAVANDRFRALCRVLGYAMHGSNPEKKMFALIGATDVGKNQVLEIVGDVLGSGLACLSMRPDLIIKRRGDRHDADESSLMGKRLAVVNELTSTMRLDEEQVLRLINPEGAVVGLRRMRQDRLEVPVTWTMYTTTNELPVAHLTPQVVNRLAVLRLSGVPVPKSAQYDVKGAVLGEEREAVLAWLVRWWREWWEAKNKKGSPTGLVITEEMKAELSSYEAENEGIEWLFINERCEVVGVPGTMVLSAQVLPLGTFWDAFVSYVKVQHPDQSVKYLKRNTFYKFLDTVPGVRVIREKRSDGRMRLVGVAGLRLAPKDMADGSQALETIHSAWVKD